MYNVAHCFMPEQDWNLFFTLAYYELNAYKEGH